MVSSSCDPYFSIRHSPTERPITPAQRHGIDGRYVDGLSLTHGAPGLRQHIWTFVVGAVTNSRHHAQCPCDNGNTIPSPPFVGNDYFCEGVTSSYRSISDSVTLWDGQVCETCGTCCQLHDPPWFTKNLVNSTTENIDLRLCLLRSFPAVILHLNNWN